MIIVKRCPSCNRIAERESVIKLSGSKLIKLSCGHLVNEDVLKNQNQKLTSTDGNKTLFKYQADDLETIEAANARVLLTYECGLGKTVTTLFTLFNHPKELFPCLIVCKSAVQIQWLKETLGILGEDYTPFILKKGGQAPIKDYPIHLISFDLLRRYNNKEGESVLTNFGFKTVIIDECQHIKSNDSKRTKALQAICLNATHVIALSATPIKNHAAEYFPILNILQPTRFPIREEFYRTWCDIFKSSGNYSKIKGLKNPSLFKEFTKDFIIYHTRDECLPHLPKERRNFEFMNIDDEALQDAYNETIKELTDFEEEADRKGRKGLEYFQNILEYLSKLRHITGLAKVGSCAVKAEEFLLSTERKLVIYIHHVDVGDLIQGHLKQLCKEADYQWEPLRLYGGMGSQKIEQVKEEFLNGPSRILIASTLAAGEGLNLQPVSDAIMVERQWNSVNEEQAERRFSRPGATASSINIDYLIAIGTVDDYLTEIVERKRKHVKEAITGEKMDFSENSVLSELVEALTKVGKPKWRLNK